MTWLLQDPILAVGEEQGLETRLEAAGGLDNQHGKKESGSEDMAGLLTECMMQDKDKNQDALIFFAKQL